MLKGRVIGSERSLKLLLTVIAFKHPNRLSISELRTAKLIGATAPSKANQTISSFDSATRLPFFLGHATTASAFHHKDTRLCVRLCACALVRALCMSACVHAVKMGLGIGSGRAWRCEYQRWY